VAGCCCYYTSR